MCNLFSFLYAHTCTCAKLICGPVYTVYCMVNCWTIIAIGTVYCRSLRSAREGVSQGGLGLLGKHRKRERLRSLLDILRTLKTLVWYTSSAVIVVDLWEIRLVHHSMYTNRKPWSVKRMSVNGLRLIYTESGGPQDIPLTYIVCPPTLEFCLYVIKNVWKVYTWESTTSEPEGAGSLTTPTLWGFLHSPTHCPVTNLAAYGSYT